MQMKWFASSTYRHLSKLVLTTLLMFSAAVSSQNHDEIVYDMVATNFGGFETDDVAHVEVRFHNPPFYWGVGLLPEGDRARHSDAQPRKVPTSLTLPWEKKGERFDEPFTIRMPPPKLLESIRSIGTSNALFEQSGE